MEAKDLMIGNYIYVNEVIQQVVELPLPSNCNIENTKPIPLTKGWLEDLGYVIDKDYPAFYQIVGHRIWMCNEMFMCDKNGVNIKYVHQLQNLYKAISHDLQQQLTFY